jgi:hypothetical protein
MEQLTHEQQLKKDKETVETIKDILKETIKIAIEKKEVEAEIIDQEIKERLLYLDYENTALIDYIKSRYELYLKLKVDICFLNEYENKLYIEPLKYNKIFFYNDLLLYYFKDEHFFFIIDYIREVDQWNKEAEEENQKL